MTIKSRQGGGPVDIDDAREGKHLPIRTIRRVVRDAPRQELRGLEQLWLYARGIVHTPGDFMPRHINVEWGRSDVARAWLKLEAARRGPHSADLPIITAPERAPV